MKQKLALKLSALALSGAVIGGGIFAYSSPSYAQAAPPEVEQAVSTITATIEALRGIAIAALAVALIPVGSMLALRFLNMVAGRI